MKRLLGTQAFSIKVEDPIKSVTLVAAEDAVETDRVYEFSYEIVGGTSNEIFIDFGDGNTTFANDSASGKHLFCTGFYFSKARLLYWRSMLTW